MRQKLFVIISVIFILSTLAFCEDTLIYEANFDKTDSKKIDWFPVIGDWEIIGGGMVGYDLENTNTNISQELEQFGAYTFIYEYKITYDLSGGQWSPAAGLHFMATDGEDLNRGESYLVFNDYGRVQLYRASAGTLTHVTQVDGFPAIEGQSSVIRVEYNSKTGEIDIFLNDVLVLEWTDPEPLYDGVYISLRTNMTAVTYDYVKVWVRK